ncbi:MAG: GDSL-type esterase/lipase family protein [Bifidobacteriaceae bacterium]|nr:GDSL-type esterase/lipase family protein [Bifidobacteriaceae bacterium]
MAHSKSRLHTKNPFKKIAIGSQAITAKRHVKLAPEPHGDRFGLVCADGVDPSGEPLKILAVGDSMIAGCGTANQSLGLVPQIATDLSERVNRPVHWQTEAKLGSTVRRIKYRLLPKGTKDGARFDVIYLGAGSNDIMARRKMDSWKQDLGDCIDMAREHTDTVIVMSCGQLQWIPSLGKMLRDDMLKVCDEQCAASLKVCAKHGATFLNMLHEDLGCENSWFWCGDQFHPNTYGYGILARHCIDAIPQDVIDRLRESRVGTPTA